ncbi:MAG TPA: hypothetical protein GXX18_01710 [Bacillales bacterium]|nr:hypothetical protein [Bacillales bacterium]
MNVTIGVDSYTFENNEEGLNELFNTINKVIIEKDVHFNYMIVDGQEIYENHEDYLQEHLRLIKEIEIKVNSVQEIINELLVSLNEYTRRAIPEIRNLIDQFYQNPDEHSWNTLQQFLEGIDWIYQTIKSIDHTDKSFQEWDKYIHAIAVMEVELPNLLEAMENRDVILIADIIQYEVLPQFEMIYEETEKAFQE